MITIKDTKNIIRIETADRQYMDFDTSEYDAERRAREWFDTMQESNKYPRRYEGTITIELKEL